MLNSLPLISVITPVYNGEKYIQDCILSVNTSKINSEFNIEHIIVNDGSTDNTQTIVENCWSPNSPNVSRTLINTPHGGAPSIARNIGIRASSGEYVFCLDADDLVLKSALRYMLTYMRQNPHVDMLHGDYLNVNAELSYNLAWDYTALKFSTQQDILCAAMTGEYLMMPCVMFKRSALDSVNLYDDTITVLGEDGDLFVRLLLNGCISESSNITSVIHRCHSESWSSNYSLENSKKEFYDRFLKYRSKLETILSEEQISYIETMLNLEPEEWSKARTEFMINRG